ncbi:flagellar basal body-associated FliL family protein [Actibacterium sp. MT2.3-13A]|uniref:flagellar basal body-associated FliL family protein n=1 Tax=Actibacterium sp. MT2.3-13A TaxID=2828332 RepID=UPI001BA6F8E6|nr:flagellar basal body-associated FliL family protein [Actibacterium sp. MT2.3-13A]
MSSTTEQGAQGAAPARKSLGRHILMVAALTLLSGAALAAGLAVSMGPKAFVALLTGTEIAQEPAPAEDTAAPPAGHGASAADGAAGPSLVVTPFKEIIVNITATTATGRRTTRFLKLNLALVYDANAEGADRIEARKLYLRDSFQDYLRQLTERDLQGTMGLVTLKAELLRRARAITDSEAPQELLVSDLIVQ